MQTTLNSMAILHLFYRIMRLVEGGLVKRWKREIFSTSKCDTKEIYVDSKTITINDMAGNFILLAIGLCSAFLMLLLEVLLVRYYQQSQHPGTIQVCLGGKRQDHQDLEIPEENVDIKCVTQGENLPLDSVHTHGNRGYENNVYSYGMHKRNGVVRSINGSIVSKAERLEVEEEFVDSKYDQNFQLRRAKTIMKPTVSSGNSVSRRRSTTEHDGHRRKMKNRHLELL